MIRILESYQPSVAVQIHRIFQRAYKIEAELVGVEEFPPLQRTIEQIVDSTNQFYGFFEQHAAQEQRDRALEAARELEAEAGILPPPPSRLRRRQAQRSQKAARCENMQRAARAKKALKTQRKADRAAFAKLRKQAAKKRKQPG